MTSSTLATVESLAADDTPPPASPPQTTNTPRATAFGALDYFQDKCARCHGDYGSFYGATFGKNLDDTKLHAVVHDMAFGPAQAPIEAKDLEVLVAWHRALRDQKPFVSVVKAEHSATGWTLSGEVSPGATLQLNGVPIETQEHSWTATTTDKGPFQLQAKLGDKTTVIDALTTAYSP